MSKIGNVGASQPLLKLLAKQTPPTQSEEKILIRRAKQGDTAAEEQILLKHGRFCVKMAKQYASKDVEFSDILEEAMLGMLRAIKNYNLKTGHRFLTYAGWWVRQGISRYISTHRRNVRLPESVLTLKNKYSNAAEVLTQKIGFTPSQEMIAEVFKGNVKRGEESVRLVEPEVSLSVESPETETTLEENLVGDVELSSWHDKQDLSERLHRALSELSQEDVYILSHAFGLNDTMVCKDKIIAETLGKPTKEVRKRKKELLQNLKLFLSDISNFV